jgi:superoxide dismutase, Fe-Mn family
MLHVATLPRQVVAACREYTWEQDSPFMDGLYPVMGNDVREHAYYLIYKKRRADYLNAWWNVVN